MELPHDFVKEFNGLKNRTRNLIIVVVVFGIGGMLLIILGDKNIPNFLVQVLYVLVTILMVYVISYQGKISALQAEIMRRQIKILEVDKLPILMFQKIDSSHDREIQDKKQENNLNSTENQENDIQVGKLNLAFEILNVSKYPVRVECVGFIPSKEHNEIIEKQHEGNESRVPPHAVRLHTLFGAKGRPIPPNQKIKVPDMGKGEADITVPGVLRIKESNEYFPDLVLEYEYDICSGRINKIEENPNNNSVERENEHNRATTDDEAVENNDENDDLFGVYYEHTKKVTPYLTVYSALITVAAIFFDVFEPIERNQHIHEISVYPNRNFIWIIWVFWSIWIFTVCELERETLQLERKSRRLVYSVVFYSFFQWINLLFLVHILWGFRLFPLTFLFLSFCILPSPPLYSTWNKVEHILNQHL